MKVACIYQHISLDSTDIQVRLYLQLEVGNHSLGNLQNVFIKSNIEVDLESKK